MTINTSQEHFNSYQTDNFQNPQICTNDSKYRLADDLSRLLYGESTDLLDEILSHPLAIDYFNVYLSLPIFAQRIFYHRKTHLFDFDPPLLTKSQSLEQTSKQWLINSRLNNYIHTDIYIESLLSLLLTKSDDKQTYIFSSVTDVRQFHQFLQSTSGIKYWNFFLDSIRLLQFRHFSRSNRIDVSYLNFIYKYYSQKEQFRSIILDDKHHPKMPDSTTSDTIWFQIAINAMYQLRNYWLNRYLSQISQLKTKYSKIESPSNTGKSLSENLTEIPADYFSNLDLITEEPKFTRHTLGNMSYIDYNPHQYIPIQLSKQQEIEDFDELDKNSQSQSEDMLFPSNRSIEDYATDENIELFYHILISDFLAGSPFLEYLSQSLSKTDINLYKTCLYLLTDAEILFSIPSAKFQEKIIKQFISRYLQITSTQKLPNSISDSIEKQRHDLINELLMNKSDQYPLLWKILLEITKFLIPSFLNYIKFDRLRFLLINSKIDDLRHHFPLINFDTVFNDQANTEESNLLNCGEQENDLMNFLNKISFNTTEKLISTDEQYECRPGERWPRLTDDALEQELRKFSTKFQPKDMQNIHRKSNQFIDKKQILDSDEDFTLPSIENYTIEIMHSARKTFEIDRFISDLMNESLEIYQQRHSSLSSPYTPRNSTPLSPLFEEILLNDTSSLTSPTFNTNNNAFVSSSSNPDFIPTSISSTRPCFSNGDNQLLDEMIKFSQKDACNEVNPLLINLRKPSIQYPDQQQLIKFIETHINNRQWPLEEYIGLKGHRAWRALKLAGDISNLNEDFMLNYHNNIDWLSSDENSGSFNERTYLILRNFNRQIVQQETKNS